MKKKYLCYGGYVTSNYDGDRHYISPFTLPNLYNVPKKECLFLTQQNCDGINPDYYIKLYPRNDGRYKISNKERFIYGFKMLIRKIRRK